MSKENKQYRIQETEEKSKATVGNLLDDDIGVDRCLRRKVGKMEIGVGKFREKIQKGHKRQGY